MRAGHCERFSWYGVVCCVYIVAHRTALRAHDVDTDSSTHLVRSADSDILVSSGQNDCGGWW